MGYEAYLFEEPTDEFTVGIWITRVTVESSSRPSEGTTISSLPGGIISTRPHRYIYFSLHMLSWRERERRGIDTHFMAAREVSSSGGVGFQLNSESNSVNTKGLEDGGNYDVGGEGGEG